MPLRDRLVKLLTNTNDTKKSTESWIRSVVSGSIYKVSDIKNETALTDIQTEITNMRSLVKDSQISTALAYYATDSTLLNTDGKIIWATPIDDAHQDAADIVNGLFQRWDINSYARDHILELATIGNLYIPTTMMYKDSANFSSRKSVTIDNNTIPDPDFDIIPSYRIPPEDIVHIYYQGQPQGYIYQPTDDKNPTTYNDMQILPESAVIHFSLGGLLGKYSLPAKDKDGNDVLYDIKFAQPLLENAIEPTQILNLLEDSLTLSSLIRTVRFVNVECGNAEENEVQTILETLKSTIEQQLSLDTRTGQAESFMNPQSPNNLIYLPKINGTDAISITDLNMSDTSDEDVKLLDYYQDKKLSVLGVPKEYFNFSSNEGLGQAGTVLSQRSALYANILQRLKTAYMAGWKNAIDDYFVQRGLSGLVGTYELHMTDTVTNQSVITFDRRDSAVSQASSVVDLLKSVGVTDADSYKDALTEILVDALPVTSGKVNTWDINVQEENEENAF